MKNKGKIIVTIAISNAGKSTWAHEQWLKDPLNTVVISRDKIRELLFSFTEDQMDEYHQREDFNALEKEVSKYEDTLTYEALNAGKTVISDATHLRPEYINKFKFWNVPIELKWFDIDFDLALERNTKRNRKVPVEFMKKQKEQYENLKKNFVFDYTPVSLEIDTTLPPAYLVDMDGTLAHMNGKRGAFDWKQVGVDDVCPALSPVVRAIYGNDVKLLIVSGRDGVCNPETTQWLKENNIDYDELHMRKEKDMRPDWQIKEEIWRDIAKEYNILAMFDDRLQVVRRARALGFKVFNVEYNNF